MTLNPPEAVSTLKAWQAIQLGRGPINQTVGLLAHQIYHRLGKMEFSPFLSYWHLHLQEIPQAIAESAWGRIATLSSAYDADQILTDILPACPHCKAIPKLIAEPRHELTPRFYVGCSNELDCPVWPLTHPRENAADAVLAWLEGECR
jgi:hypothetical protein